MSHSRAQPTPTLLEGSSNTYTGTPELRQLLFLAARARLAGPAKCESVVTPSCRDHDAASLLPGPGPCRALAPAGSGPKVVVKHRLALTAGLLRGDS